MRNGEVEEHLLKEKLRIRQSDHPQPSTPYRTNQAKGKAIKQAQSSLPVSPCKRCCVVETLAKSVGIIQSAPSASSSKVSEELKKLILAVYSSMTFLGRHQGERKDRVIIREVNNDGKKLKELSKCDTY